MIDSLISPFRQMLVFRGRSRRRDYWLFVAWQFPILFGSLMIAFLVFGSAGTLILLPEIMIWGTLGYTLVCGLPMLALQVRRLHDQDKTGWWVIVSLIPYLGLGWLIFLMVQPGTWGPNRFGPDPRHAGWQADLFE